VVVSVVDETVVGKNDPFCASGFGSQGIDIAFRIFPALLLLTFLSELSVSAATIRSKSDLRLWETVHDRTIPLRWSWADGADSATLVFSNRVTRAVYSVPLSREENALNGNCAQPVPQTGRESLVDVTLVQKSGDTVVERGNATLAYVDGAGGGPITVRALGTKEWNHVAKTRVFAFDPAWLGQEGDSGYDVIRAVKGMCLVFH